MDEQLFINRQTESTPKNYGMIALIVIAIVLVVGGGIGIVFSINSNGDNTDQDTLQAEPQQDIEDLQTDELIQNNTNNSQSETEDVANNSLDSDGSVNENNDTTQNQIENEETSNPIESNQAQFSAPVQQTQIHLYFLQNGQLTAALRDKPSENLATTIIVETVKGPNQTEKSAGYTSTWSFSGNSNCGSGRVFQYNISGTVLNLELCQDINGDIELFKTSLAEALKQQTVVESVRIISPAGEEL